MLKAQLRLTLLLFLILSLHGYGMQPPVSEHSKMLNAIAVNDTLNVGDDLLTILSPPNTVWTHGYCFNEVNGRLTFGVTTTPSVCMPTQFTATIIVEVSYWKYGASKSSTLMTTTDTLVVNFSKEPGQSYKEKDIRVYADAHYIQTKLLSATYSVSGVSQFLYLRSEIFEDRYLCTTNAVDKPKVGSVSMDAATNEIVINIDTLLIKHADEYDLEWTFVDEYDASSQKVINKRYFDFRDNSTRVTLSSLQYRLSNIFEKGYLVFRVRVVEYYTDPATPSLKRRVEGAWSTIPPLTGSTGDNGYIQDNTNSWIHIDDDLAHQTALNWQYMATYAEEGKKSEGISYFDGSLRKRQSVSHNFSDATAIVGETVYDYQGRPAIEILPVPVVNGKVTFYPNFNRDDTSYVYSSNDFDKDADNCVTATHPMENTSGAEGYYSASNAFGTPVLGSSAPVPNFNDYTPLSAGYPFVQTEYMPDNTNRVITKTQPGATHKLGSGHETRYMYSVPTQEELDKLFGNEVGYANHYKKSTVIDPNGQISTSYQDLSGHTIATALSGQTPSSTTALSYNTATVNNITDMITPDDPSRIENNQIIVSKTFTPDQDGAHGFYYEMTPQKYMPGYCPGNTAPCYDCIYDLTISLTNLCGEEQLNGNGGTEKILISRTLGGSPSSIDGTCDAVQTYSFVSDAVLTGSMVDGYLAVNLVQGTTYTLTKTLTVNKKALDDYMNHYITNQTCKTLTDFENEEWDRTDKSGCDMTCEECDAMMTLPQYASKTAYIAYMTGLQMGEGTETPPGMPVMQSEWGDAYDNIKKRCDQICGRVSECDVYRDMLIADITPGGQYAQYHYEDGVPVATAPTGTMINVLSAADEDNYYQSVLAGQNVTINGESVSVATLDLATFIQYWDQNQKAWGDLLIQSHPEYCEIEWCESTKAIRDFDAAMMSVETYDEAVSANYLQFEGINGNLKVISTYANGSYDPFFSQIGDPAKTTLHDKLYYYQDLSGSTISVWDVPVVELYCQDETPVNMPGCVAFHRDSVLGCKAYRDYYWKTIRSLYISAKQDALEQAKGETCSPSIPPGAVRRMINAQNAKDNLPDHPVSTDESYVNTQLGEQGDKQCEAYRDEWRDALKGCTSLSPTELEQVLDKMVEVCKGGYDENHPMGSSTVSPANMGTAAYNSFEQIFTTPFTFTGGGPARTIYVKNLCDNLLIKMPGSYNHDYFATTSPMANRCACDPTLSSSDPNCPCANSGAALDIKDAINLLRTDIDDDKKCSNCLDCAAFAEYYRWYLAQYGVYHDTSLVDQQLLTSFINQKAGFNLTYNDYRNHLVSCLNYGEDIVDTPFTLFASMHLPTLPLAGTMDNQPPILPALTQNTGGLPYPQTYVSCEDFMRIVDQFFTEPIYRATLNDVQKNIYEWITDYETTYAANLVSVLNLEFPSASFTIAKLREQMHSCTPMSCNQFRTFLSLSGVSLYPTRANLLKPSNRAAFEAAITKFNTYLDTLSANNPVWDPYLYLDMSVIPAYAYFSKFDSVLMLNYADMCQESNLCTITLKNKWDGTDSVTNATLMLNELVKPCSLSTVPFCMGNPMSTQNWNVKTSDPAILDFIPYKFKNPDYLKFTSFGYSTIIGSNIIAPRVYYVTLNAVQELSVQIVMRTISYLGDMQHYQYSYAPPDFDYSLITKFIPIEIIGYNQSNLNIIYEAVYNSATDGVKSQFILVSFPTFAFSNDFLGELCYPAHKVCNTAISQLSITMPESPCKTRLRNIAKTNALASWNNYMDSLRTGFENAYLAKCLEASQTEVLKRRYDERKYHYTLYYYDRGGNLVKTVPPAGINILTTTQVTSTKSKRGTQTFTTLFSGTTPDVVLPSHTMPTQYVYNTLNQLIEQTTPDAGKSKFWYDAVGRIVLSQNAKQALFAAPAYSYTIYDGLGRITEVAQVCSLSTTAAAVVGGTASGGRINTTDMKTWLGIPASGVTPGGTTPAVATQITRTYYDEAVIAPAGITLDNLRKRVVHSTYSEENGLLTYSHAVHYSYDIEGNVKSLYRENKVLAVIGQDLKQVDYDYDLISGKVKQVTYQPLEPDQYVHQYFYDLDNRLKSVNTGTSRWTMDQDAAYQYYPHGPLARTVLGSMQVQGIDNAYTIQGWLKGVNSSDLQGTRDVGKDGNTELVSNTNANTAPDVYGYSLHYFEGDYTSVGTFTSTTQFTSLTSGSTLSNSAPSLYNGNISAMITTIGKFGWPLAMGYTYDQLNRLNSATYYANFNPYSNSWLTTASMPDYYNQFTYDANGNIITQIRRGSNIIAGNTISMDSMTYNYYAGTNKLKQVQDKGIASAYTDDIDNQVSTTNYEYDEIGNLIEDEAEEIQTIEWNVYGKITKIQRTSTSLKPDLQFEYTPDGHRSMKVVIPKTGDEFKSYTYYVRDAQGNIMATYQRSFERLGSDTFADAFTVNDWQLYGSNRVGNCIAGNKLVNAFLTATLTDGVFSDTDIFSYTEMKPDYVNFALQRGNKRYELTDHLGNVKSVISDKYIQPCNSFLFVSDFSQGNDTSWKSDPTRTVVSYNSTDGCLEGATNNGGNAFASKNFLPPLVIGGVYKVTFTMDLGGWNWRLNAASGPAANWKIIKRLDRDKGIKEYSIVFKAYTTDEGLSIGSETGGAILKVYKVTMQRLDTGNVTNGKIVDEKYDDGVSLGGWVSWSGDNITVANVGGKIKVTSAGTAPYNGVSGIHKSFNTIPGHAYRVRAYIDRSFGINTSRFLFGHWDNNYTQWSYPFASNDFYNVNFNPRWFEYYFIAQGPTSKVGVHFSLSSEPAYWYTIDSLTIQDVYLPETQTDLIKATDYSPFGAPLTARSYELEKPSYNNLMLYDQFVWGNDGWTPDGTSTLTLTNQSKLKIDGSGAWRYFDVTPGHTYKLSLDFQNNGTEAGVVNVTSVSTSTLLATLSPLNSDGQNFTFTTDASTTQVKIYLGRTTTNAASYIIDNVMVKDITAQNNILVPQKVNVNKFKLEFTNSGNVEGFTGVGTTTVNYFSSQYLYIYNPNNVTLKGCTKTISELVAGATYSLSFTLWDELTTGSPNTYTVFVKDLSGNTLATNVFTLSSGTQGVDFTVPSGATSVVLTINGERPSPNRANNYYVDNVTLSYITTTYAVQAASGYRFGFNGKESDNETYGAGNEYDYGERIYNPRLGRWFASDAKVFFFPSNSPYNFAGNNPILMVDKGGNEQIIYLYINPVYNQNGVVKKLSSKEIKQITRKMQHILDKTGLAMEIVTVTTPMEQKYMDGSDVSVVISNIYDAYSIASNFGGRQGEDLINKAFDKGSPGITSRGNFSIPAFAFIDGQEKREYPNYLDQLAYEAMHEIIHRLSSLSGYQEKREDGHDTRGIMLKGEAERKVGTNTYPEFFKEDISKWRFEMFQMPASRYFTIGALLNKIPKDNATKKKDDDQKKNSQPVEQRDTTIYRSKK